MVFRVRIFFVCCIAATLSGCATIRDHCKEAANPASCNTKFSLGVLSCESEATRKTPITKTATGNYQCDGFAQPSGTSQYYVNSTCRPQVKESRDKAVWDGYMKACIQSKIADGRFKQ